MRFTGVAAQATAGDSVEASRRQMTRDGLAISAYALPVGLVFGLTALQAHYSFLDVLANSAIAFAGGAQFAAAGLVKDGASWLAIAGVVALVNARHLLYSAALAPYAAEVPSRTSIYGPLPDRRDVRPGSRPFPPHRPVRPARLLDRGDVDLLAVDDRLVHRLRGRRRRRHDQLGLDVAFPAAMAGLSLGMVSGRRDVAAALGAVAVAVPVGPRRSSIGLVAGALIGPFFGLAVPASPNDESSAPETPEPSAEAGLP